MGRTHDPRFPALNAPKSTLTLPQFQDIADLPEAATGLTDGRYVDINRQQTEPPG